MADNYLEKRMEDLRNGRTYVSRPTVSNRKGALHVTFPERRVLVTGGLNGIGLAVVRSFLKAGCRVAVFDIDSEKGEEMARKEGIRFSCVDVSDADCLETAFRSLLKAWRDVDIIVSNAGIGMFGRLAESEISVFDKVIATNLRPSYILGRLWAQHREKCPNVSEFGGRMILVSSTRHLQSEAGTEAYSASKGGVATLAHSLMMSLSAYGVTVNCISPGWIHTDPEEVLRESDHLQHPSRRVGCPEDISRVCIFLSLPDNDFINGADIVVDGGMTRKMIYEP